ncbi:hypothetical protein [Streptomyces sp. NPDC058701]|uniref:hypothetical protein n=1 Tax=Streptomyces sp. NPDC058701 TaxID=3346608 RepID=UPI00366788C5
MTFMKKCVTAAAVAAVLGGAPTLAHALTSANEPVTSVAAASATSTSAKAVARTVAVGERVQIAPKAELWLTKDGKHWSTPDNTDQFRSVVDGNIDMHHGSVSLQAEPAGDSYLLTGVYVAKGAASVKVQTEKGTVTGSIVQLAGANNWGAWYATAPLPDKAMSKQKQNYIRSVSVYDAGGNVLVTFSMK